MRGLDTNVLARCLVLDDETQFRRAVRFVAEQMTAGEELWIDMIVLCELVWVLRAGYGRNRAEVAAALAALFEAASFTTEDRDLVHRALDLYCSGKGDFANYLLGLRNQRCGCSLTATFDRRPARETGFAAI